MKESNNLGGCNCVPTDKELYDFAVESQFGLFCDIESECLAIMRETLYRFCDIYRPCSKCYGGVE